MLSCSYWSRLSASGTGARPTPKDCAGCFLVDRRVRTEIQHHEPVTDGATGARLAPGLPAAPEPESFSVPCQT